MLKVRGWFFCTRPFCTHPFCTHLACSSMNSSEGCLRSSPSEMYLANCVAFCGISVCVLLICVLFVGFRGTPGFPGFSLKNHIFFRIVFLKVFFFIVTSFLDHFLKVFSYFFHLFFETFFGVKFLNIFLIFLILSFSANPRRHAFYCSPLVYKRFRHFRKR